MSLCTSLRNFIQIGPPSAEKMTSCRFSRWRISASLDFRGPIMGSLNSPCTTSYRLLVEIIALNCLVFLENRLFAFWRQTDKQTNRWTRPLHEAALAIASGGLISNLEVWCLLTTYRKSYMVQHSDSRFESIRRFVLDESIPIDSFC